LSAWVLLAHVAAAFWFVAGLIGRDVTLAMVRRSDRIEVVTALSELAGRFDRWMVIPGSIAVLILGLLTTWARGLSFTSAGNRWLPLALVIFLSIIPLVPFVFVPKGKVFDAALAEAQAEGSVTPELTASLEDRAVLGARMYERVAVAVVIVLMVVKPF
jgi:Predicted integral membrane protein (DUF2269)